MSKEGVEERERQKKDLCKKVVKPGYRTLNVVESTSVVNRHGCKSLVSGGTIYSEQMDL